jgi:hypothetical protein
MVSRGIIDRGINTAEWGRIGQTALSIKGLISDIQQNDIQSNDTQHNNTLP